MELPERKKRILEAIITYYIRYAEPVGSRSLSRLYNFGISPATIRNEMADLEEMGFLAQPHTSAGRVPSETGYRFFVDELVKSRRFLELRKQGRKYLINRLKEEKAQGIEEIIRLTAQILSEITNYTSLVFGPQVTKSSFNQMRFIPLKDNKALMVVVTDMGLIEDKTIDLPEELNVEEVERVVEYLNKRLKGLTIDEINRDLFLSELRSEVVRKAGILDEALNMLSGSQRLKGNIVLDGRTNILDQPEFKDMEKVRKILSIFEREEILIDLMSDFDDIVVRIGRENPVEEVKDCSLITASYEVHGKSVGTIGVLGPKRMNYSEVIAIVTQIAKELGLALKHQGE
ncbi:heat-inducible transcriptional repressor HrcA [Natranaerofaba carboxydovora]|uniref:heat-inducible transcriptional repressor HrcA n=1 Tax=Natranaerofaba carboxydovora TaxID=2742683 RepID=UPI001F13496D|nr:heat-inducible transcriptional repressor HrcA [Natranaerofaba carboxydovora]UMZ73070.1 Heat-inducible transcription repressor HrcA [Natranaerofaba carboxydovora]